MMQLVAAAGAGFLSALCLTAVVRRGVLALGVLDHPDAVRKLHRAPIPLLGGIAVLVAWVLGLMAACAMAPLLAGWGMTHLGIQGLDDCDPFRTLGLSWFLAGGVILIAGILDDIYTLRPHWKLVGQACAACLVIAGGLVVKRVALFGFTMELGWVGAVFTLVWLVGSMNALNMLDGMDGLASTIGLIICVMLACLAWLTGNPMLAVATMALAGALAGFLVFNFPPARIYLGDAGSVFIGFLIGAVAIKGSLKAPATLALAVPVLFLAVPIFDGIAAVIRRRLTGRPFYSPDRGHIHHCLQQRGWSTRRILAFVGAMCTLTGLFALGAEYFHCEPVAMVAAGVILCGCIQFRLFGYQESLLFMCRSKIFWLALRCGLVGKHSNVLSHCSRLRECGSEEEMWSVMVGAAQQLSLSRVHIQLDAPGNDYLGQWSSDQQELDHPEWHAVIPLTRGTESLGKLSCWGYQNGHPFVSDIIILTAMSNALAAAYGRLVDEPRHRIIALSSIQAENSRGVPTMPELRLQERKSA